MITHTTPETIGDVAGGEIAAVPLPLATPRSMKPFSSHPPRRGMVSAQETLLLDQITASVQDAQPLYSRTMITRYFAALCGSPLVLVRAASEQAGLELGRLFAEALLGAGSCQHTLIRSSAWHDATGENIHYRSVHTRFSTMRCQAIAQEAADPLSVGKAFFVQFGALPFSELADHVEACGTAQAVALSAVIEPQHVGAALARFPQAALVELELPDGLARHSLRPPPPVGWQRLWLQAVARRRNHVHLSLRSPRTHADWCLAAS